MLVYVLTSFTATEPINSEKEGVVYGLTSFTATELINSEKEGVVYGLTSFTAVMSFQNNTSAKPETLRICVFFFTPPRERIFIKAHGITSRCVVGPEAYTVCKRVRGSFSPEILLAEAVKELTLALPLIYNMASLGKSLPAGLKSGTAGSQTVNAR